MRPDNEIKKFFRIEINKNSEEPNLHSFFPHKSPVERCLVIRQEEWDQEYFLIYQSYSLDQRD